MKTVNWKVLNETERELALARPVQDLLSRTAVVSEIIERVRIDGDQALRDYTEKFDGVTLKALKVTEDEFQVARACVPISVKSAIKQAKMNIECFHQAQLPKELDVNTQPGVRCQLLYRPIQTVGLYVPGGSAPLVSTVMMLAVPAVIAGCENKIICTPPRLDASVDPAILVAAEICGITEIYKVGGAQAIAAMAYGSRSIPKVDKIFGPGNVWVLAAKQCVSQDPEGPAIDMPAGPSEVMVIADSSANARFVASDLLSQAEHDPQSQVILVATDENVSENILAEIKTQLPLLPRAEIARSALSRSVAINVTDMKAAIDIANRYAPEHLILQVENARKWLGKINNAGSVFLGKWSPESVGDYASGTNHVLPTSGAARSYSGLGVRDFIRSMSVQELSKQGLEQLAPVVTTLAELEGLTAHKRAVTMRLAEVIENV